MPVWLKNVLLTSVLKLSGLKAYIAKFFLDYGWGWLSSFFEKLVKDAERSKIQEKAKEEMEQVNKKPESTPEERAEAYAKYLNSGN